MRRPTAALLLVAAIGLAAPAAQAGLIIQSFSARGFGDYVELPGKRGSDQLRPWNPSTEIRYQRFDGDSRSFRSELAAISWNALVVKVAETPPEDRGDISIGEFDPELPLRPDGCSFRRPDQCDVAGTFFPKDDTRGDDGGSAAIPEPGAALLFGAGFALVVARVARRRSA